MLHTHVDPHSLLQKRHESTDCWHSVHWQVGTSRQVPGTDHPSQPFLHQPYVVTQNLCWDSLSHVGKGSLGSNKPPTEACGLAT